MAETEYILECKGISKAFGGTQALKDVELPEIAEVYSPVYWGGVKY